MPAGTQMRQTRPTAQQPSGGGGMRPNMNARPITGAAGAQQQPGGVGGPQQAGGAPNMQRVMNGSQMRPTGPSGGAMPPGPPGGVAQARPTFKYTPNMRNPPAGVAGAPGAGGGVGAQAGGVAPQAVHIQGQEPLTATMHPAAQPQEQKQMLGERLFPLIQSMYPDLAGKITGMLLEIDNSELLHMLESRESLKAKVEEAVAVLQAHQAKQVATVVKDGGPVGAATATA